jgi:hypothetical protein
MPVSFWNNNLHLKALMKIPTGTETSKSHGLPGDSAVSTRDLLDKLSAMSELAKSHYQTGLFNEAEEPSLQVVKIQTHIFAEDHPDTMLSMARLAYTKNRLGKWEEANDLGLEVFKKRKQVLGDKHPDTLQSLSNLA